MYINNHPGYYEPALSSNVPQLSEGEDIPSSASFFTSQGVGSQYFRNVTGGFEVWTKFKNDGNATDWLGRGAIAQTFGVADMTDGGSTVGTIVLDGSIPDKSFVVRSHVVNVTGFAGDSSATIQIGDGSDADRYSTGTPSVFSSVDMVAIGVPSGTEEHTAAVATVTVTITSGSDFSDVVTNGSGEATVIVEYNVVA